MVSTFHGLEVARRGMMTQQAALYTTGHNIANANTPGYTRQRVNFVQTEPYPPASRNRPQIPGQMGTGVKAGDIQRIRDSFVDMQFRGENSKLGYWEAKSAMLSQMENILNEPSDTGLANSMDEFWNSLQDLAVQPQNNGARRVVRQRGIALANTFNYTANQLKAIQQDYRNEIDISQKRINSILRQINEVNKQIGSIEPHGYLPNDLYDERDRLVDELSSYVSIKVEVKPSGGLASANAEGLYNIYLTDPQGNILEDKSDPANPVQIKLIEAVDNTGKLAHIANGIYIQYGDKTVLDSPVEGIKIFQLKEKDEGFVDASGANIDPESENGKFNFNQFSDFNTLGKLKGYIEGYGYKFDPTPNDTTNNDDVIKGVYNEMLADLDEMAYTFAKHFNLVHRSGWSLNEIRNGASNDQNFFEFEGIAPTDANPKGAASKIKIAKAIEEDVDNIAAAAEGNVLAGAMEREAVNNGTVGNPSFTGIYNSADKPTSYAGIWPVADQIEVSVKYDGTNWQYQFRALDSSGAEKATTGFINFSSTPQTIFGIELNTSLVTTKQNNDTWKVTFNAQGVKTSDEAFSGNGSNALKLADVKDNVLDYGGNLTNVHTFYQGMIGSLGDMASESNRMTETATILKDSVEQRRMSISSVSLDEEMTNMIKFQHAYNAAARNITMIDEMLDKIINGMGLVGR